MATYVPEYREGSENDRINVAYERADDKTPQYDSSHATAVVRENDRVNVAYTEPVEEPVVPPVEAPITP